MPNGSQEAIDMIVSILKEMKLMHEVTEVFYRIDHEDYRVLFGDTHHCEIQEKTVNDVIQFKNGDAKRQIQYSIKNPVAWEEWEKPGPDGVEEENISLDDDI